MAKRIFQGVVLFFAIYAFAFVPLGKKPALDHVRAIIGTPAAQQAASEVKGGVKRLVRRLKDDARDSTEELHEEDALSADSELELDERPAPSRTAQKREPRSTGTRGKDPTVRPSEPPETLVEPPASRPGRPR